jgi:hypothetical protein
LGGSGHKGVIGTGDASGEQDEPGSHCPDSAPNHPSTCVVVLVNLTAKALAANPEQTPRSRRLHRIQVKMIKGAP